MVTQELKDMPPFSVRRSFWLNKKGRIEADLRIVDLPDRTLLELDVHAAPRTVKGLAPYIVTENVNIRDATDQLHRFSLHGPTGLWLLAGVSMTPMGAMASGPGLEELAPGRAMVVSIAEAECVVYREDLAGEMGLELIVPADKALAVWQMLIEAGHDRAHGHGAPPEGSPPAAAHPWQILGSKVRLRPAGWHAFNIARIEAGSPLYYIDFGPDSLPAETGVLNDRVSFKKGCYLGQEVVARMHSRGHSKQVLVGVDFDTIMDPSSGFPLQPLGGTSIHAAEPATNKDEPIGMVTSSALSPMNGSRPVALVQVKQAYAAAGTALVAPTMAPSGDFRLPGKVRDTLWCFCRNAMKKV
jgi:folate-binding protein YgfZ